MLDPFAGSGTTLKAAHHLSRRWVGYEVQADYCRLARRRIREPMRLRDQLIASFDKMPLDEHGRAMGEIIPTRARRAAAKRSRAAA